VYGGYINVEIGGGDIPFSIVHLGCDLADPVIDVGLTPWFLLYPGSFPELFYPCCPPPAFPTGPDGCQELNIFYGIWLPPGTSIFFQMYLLTGAEICLSAPMKIEF
jgi:hypothetical protein